MRLRDVVHQVQNVVHDRTMRPRQRVVRLRERLRLVPGPGGLRELLIRRRGLNLRHLLNLRLRRLNLALRPRRLSVLSVAPEAHRRLLLAHLLHLF